MAFSGIYFIPLGLNGHKIPPAPPPGTHTEWDVYHRKVYGSDIFDREALGRRVMACVKGHELD